MYSVKSGCSRAKVAEFRQFCCIRTKVVYWDKVVEFGQKWLYSCKSVCIISKMVVFGQSGCIWAKVVVLEQKWMYSGKVFVFGQKCL